MIIPNKIKKVLLQRFGYSAVGVGGSIVPAPPASSSREGLTKNLLNPYVKQFNRTITCISIEIIERIWKVGLGKENVIMIREKISKNKQYLKFKHKFYMERGGREKLESVAE